MTWSRRDATWRDAECKAALAAAGAGLAALAAAAWIPGRWLPVCAFKAWTGQPCLTCGATRALRLLPAGHIGGALRVQPLLTLALFAAGAWTAYAAAGALLHLPRLRPHPTRRESRLLVVAGVAFVLANWAYLLATGR